jgi:hypothetical protein
VRLPFVAVWRSGTVAALVLGLAGVACSDGGTGAGPPDDALRRLETMTGATAAATDGLVLVSGGTETISGSADRRMLEVATLVALADGSTTAAAIPVAEVPLMVDDALGVGGSFLVVGVACGNGDLLPEDDWNCQPGTGSTVRLDPDDPEEWTVLPLPEDVAAADGFDARLGLTPGGTAFLVARDATPTPEMWRLLVLDGDEWAVRAELGPDVEGVCATEDAFHVLTSTPTPMPVDLEQPPVPFRSFSLRRLPLVGGSASTVHLPPEAAVAVSVAVEVACDRTGVYVTGAPAEPDGGPMSLHANRGAGWETIEGDWEGPLVHAVTSSPGGIAVVSFETGSGSYVLRTVTALEDSARIEAATGVNDPMHIVPAGDGFVVIRPSAEDDADVVATVSLA